MFKIPDIKAEIILVMGSASERHRYNAKSSLIGSAHTQNDPRKDFKNVFLEWNDWAFLILGLLLLRMLICVYTRSGNTLYWLTASQVEH